jgi:predicted nucleic acid-binding protein
MLVIADTSPLNYLILIDAVEILPRLYGRVILPAGARDELRHQGAPPPVSEWANSLPAWVEVTAVAEAECADPGLTILGRGESEAIALAVRFRDEMQVLLLLDEEAARREAAARGLRFTGTLGVLKSAARNGWIDLPESFARLRRTNFRVSEALLNELLSQR